VSEGERRAAVAGKPIAHSLSPLIHNIGYQAAGLQRWRYTAVECAEAELADLVNCLGPEWAGLSCTMPLKQEALAVADEVSPFAAALGAANTLVRRGGGWYADNTDAPGMVDLLRSVDAPPRGRVSVLGAGGTARAALAAARELRAAAVTVYLRRPEACDELRIVADVLDVPLRVASWSEAARSAADDVVFSTVPKGVADGLAGAAWRPGTVLLDAVYDPWPTPLATAATRGGCRVFSGLDLLLAQGVRQFEIFTATPAPVEAMRSALWSARYDRSTLR
jgi:shikimate dehydrogenase